MLTLPDVDRAEARALAPQSQPEPLAKPHTFEAASDDPNSTDYGARVRMQPKGFLRIMTPLFRMRSPKVTATLMGNVKRLIEIEIPTTP